MKNDATKQPEAFKKRTILIISIVVLGMVTIWATITTVIPLIVGDGLSNYSGVRREAAESALNSVESVIDNKLRWSYIFHADEVRPINDSEKAKFCQDSPSSMNDPNNTAYYAVAVSYRQWFQFTSRTSTLVFCSKTGVYNNLP